MSEYKYISAARRQRERELKRQQRRRLKRQIRALFQSILDKIRRALTVGGSKGEALRTDDGPFPESQGRRH